MQTVARIFAGPVMALAGINHFIMPRFYERIMPDYVPAQREMVYASGVAEFLGAIATLHPRTRRAGGWVLVATLLAVFPANIHMAIHPERYPDIPGGQATLLARLPLQVLFLYWVWLAALKDPPSREPDPPAPQEARA